MIVQDKLRLLLVTSCLLQLRSSVILAQRPKDNTDCVGVAVSKELIHNHTWLTPDWGPAWHYEDTECPNKQRPRKKAG